MKNLALFLLLFMVSHASAQSLEITAVPGTVFCSYDTLDIQYTANGSFTARNSFTIQLSDAKGGFDSVFVNLGSKRTTQSGTIRVGIPKLIASSLYHLRIISSEPYIVGSTYPTNLSFGPKPVALAAVSQFRESNSFYVLMVDDTMRFLNQSEGATAYRWEFGPDAIPAVSSEVAPLVRFTTAGKKYARLTAYTPFGCSSTWYSDAGDDQILLTAVTCEPKIPATTAIDSTPAEEYYESPSVWVVPGGRASQFGTDATYYVEPGGSIIRSMGSVIIYLKAGSTIQGDWYGGAVIYESGASLDIRKDRGHFIKCPDLEFDYSDAPPYKIDQASVSRVRESTVRVYPNPAVDRLTIEHKENLIREISIRNALGSEQLFVKPEGLGRTTIDVTALPAGLYFIDLITDRGIETHKLVVQR